MKRLGFYGFAAGVVCLASWAFAVDVTVNSTQPEVAGSNYQTIGAALTYVKAQAEPRIVRITATYPEASSFCVSNGGQPVRSSYNSTPSEYTSLRVSTSRLPNPACSGLM